MVQDRGMFLSILPATRGERRLALTVVAISLGVFLVCLPFAKQPILHIDAFIPAYAATVPLFDTAPFSVNGKLQGGTAHLWARGPQGQLAMQASAEIE